MIEQLIERLRQAGLDLSAEDIVDALWLAERLDAPSVRTPPPVRPDERANSTVRIEEVDTTAPATRPLSDLPLFASDALTVDSDSEESDVPSGFPFKAPAAKALPNAVGLSRSLRSLSRNVPSQTQVELDEEATVEQIAALRIFSPVVKPEIERWLDLELVVEESAMSFVWRKTVEEFKRKVLERLGAFRNLRMWRLQADEHRQLQLWPYIQGTAVKGMTAAASLSGVRPRSPKILVHPSQRRLILLVSDCRSSLWQARPQRPLSLQRSYQPTIYDWLQCWSAQGPTTLVQLLPERLWSQTELGYGDRVQLSALQAGLPNTHLSVEGVERWQIETSASGKTALPESLAMPVVTLEASPMRQWAKVVAGRGNERTPGFWFDIGLLQQFPSEGGERWTGLSAEANVNRFLASGASPIAKQLLRLMAAAPVSLSVVHLLQEKMLKAATPVHVAEVYMSGLLYDTGGHNQDGEPVYDFREGVRERLIKVSSPDLSLQVFTKLTEKIKEELGEEGESIESFDALLSPDPDWVKSSGLVAPFAVIALSVLKAMGGDYADYAAFVEENPTPKRTTTEVSFPPLQTLDFVLGELVDDEEPSDDNDRVDRFPPPLKMANFKVATISLPQQRLEVFEFQTAKIEYERRLKRSWQSLWLQSQVSREWVVKKSRAQARRFVEPLADDLTLEMLAIPGGRFLMGSPESEPGRSPDEGPQREVTVSDFFMGRYPVTQAQWRFAASLPQVNRDLNPDPCRFKGADLPVESVSWYEAIEFCDRLSAFTKRTYRLPTEAEWEYACRAGTTTPFHFGDTILTDVANYNGNYTYADGPRGKYRRKTTPVDEFDLANAFGLSDMHGNVYEWCQDHWHDNYEGAPTDGSAWLTNDKEASRVHRGGSWSNGPRYCRSAYRLNYTPDGRYLDIGFRVSCSAPRT